MEGVEILNVIPEQQIISGTNVFGFVIIVLCLVGFIISLAFDHHEDANGLIACVTLAVITIPLIIGVIFISDTSASIKPTQYEIMVSDEVNYIELTEKYEIIEQRGKILIVQERE